MENCSSGTTMKYTIHILELDRWLPQQHTHTLTSSNTGLLVPFCVLVCWMSLPQATFTTGFRPLPTSFLASRT